MATKKTATKKAPARTTTGASYSGKHAGLRRQYTDSFEEFEKQDRLAQKRGVPWSVIVREALRALTGVMMLALFSGCSGRVEPFELIGVVAADPLAWLCASVLAASIAYYAGRDGAE